MTEDVNPVIENAQEIIGEWESVNGYMESLTDEAEEQEIVTQTEMPPAARGEPSHQLTLYLATSETPIGMRKWIDEKGLKIYDAGYFEDGEGETRFYVTLVYSPQGTLERICELMREGLSPMEAVVYHAANDKFIPINQLKGQNGDFATGRQKSNLSSARTNAEEKIRR